MPMPTINLVTIDISASIIWREMVACSVPLSTTGPGGFIIGDYVEVICGKCVGERGTIVCFTKVYMILRMDSGRQQQKALNLIRLIMRSRKTSKSIPNFTDTTHTMPVVNIKHRPNTSGRKASKSNPSLTHFTDCLVSTNCRWMKKNKYALLVICATFSTGFLLGIALNTDKMNGCIGQSWRLLNNLFSKLAEVFLHVISLGVCFGAMMFKIWMT